MLHAVQLGLSMVSLLPDVLSVYVAPYMMTALPV